MAGVDYINEAIEAVKTVLEASPLFMAAAVLPGATGTIRSVETDLPDTTTIRGDKMPHASVVYLGHEPADDGTIESTDYNVRIGIRLYHRGTDRSAVWRAIQKAAAAITGIVEQENEDGLFGGYCVIARDNGGQAIDTQEENGYGAMLASSITLTIQHSTPTT